MILICCLAAFAATLIGWLSYTQSRQVQIDTFRTELNGEAQIVGLRISEMLGDMIEDARIISASDSITDYIALSTSQGPVNPAVLANLKRRIEYTFSSVLKVNADYSQIRIIRTDAHGQELVRVDKRNDQIAIIPPARLQSKAQEPYFQIVQEMGPDDAAFSEVSLNRENGEVSIPVTPTIRAFIPIMHSDGRQFGAIAINANIESRLRELFAHLPPRHGFALVDGSGNYFLSGTESGSGNWVMAHDAEAPPAMINWLENKAEQQSHFADDHYFEYVPATHSSPVKGFEFGVVSSAPRSAAPVSVSPLLLADKIAFATIAVLISVGLAFFYVKHMTRPLNVMAREIGAWSNKEANLKLPINAKDEIGELARSFNRLVNGLRQEEVKLSSIIENVNDALIVIRENGLIEKVNPACSRIFGYSEEELLGRNVSMLMPEYERRHHHSYLSNYKKTGKKKIIGVGREIECRASNGNEFPADLSVSEFEYQGQRYFCGIIRDITERRQMDRMRDEFVSTVNHELRTPLSSVYGAICILHEKSLYQLDFQGRRLVDIAMVASNQLSRLVDDILDLEKIAHGKLEFSFETRDLLSLTQDIVDNHQPLALQNNVSLRVEAKMGNSTVRVDPYRFHQALANLLSNACKFAPARDEVLIIISILNDNIARVSVQDNGPGIPDDFQPRVFEKFAQADGSNTRSPGSSGLGLAITKALVEGMGGEVAFRSSPSTGTVFHIDMPIVTLLGKAA